MLKRTKKISHIRNQLNHHDPKFIRKWIDYFSILEKYFRYESVGVENIPQDKSSIVVMNHGIIPYHGFLLTKHVIEKRNIFPRGLGAGFLFDIPLVRDFFLKGGAVNANPKNAIELLKSNNCLMLAPGGIYEGLVCHPQMTRIPWERRKGFVELAIKTKTSIIPTFCGGVNNAYFNSQFLLKLRIKILESTRFSLPIFFGIGLLPFPIKMIHYVGAPIKITRKKGETKEAQINRIHEEVMTAMHKLSLNPAD